MALYQNRFFNTLHQLRNSISMLEYNMLDKKHLFSSVFAVALFLGVFISSTPAIHAQDEGTILTYQDYITQVLKYHPLAQQAELQEDFASAAWLSAKGNLDPYISSDWNQKYFSEKLYYREYGARMKVPTRLGIDVVGGYENTSGIFLNPEDNTDTYGLFHLGFEANVWQGLFVNERSMGFEQARIAQDIAANKQAMIRNGLVYSATAAYLNWQQYYNIQEVILENIALAEEYLENTRTSFLNGEKTAMDTLEAYIILQDRETTLIENARYLAKSRQYLETFLWADGQPEPIAENRQPLVHTVSFWEGRNTPDIEQAIEQHPVLVEKYNKRASLAVEQRLKREKLKPKLKLKFQPLLHTTGNLIPRYSVNNYAWGIDFSMPLLMRSEKADIQVNELKIEGIDLELEQKENDIRNKMEASLQQQTAILAQLELQERNLVGYKQLLDAENEKFRYGESSVFLLNKRQEKYLAGQIKLIQLQIKYHQEKLAYLYMGGWLGR